MRLGHRIPLFAALVPLLLPAVAAGADLQTFLDDYRDNGRVDGCYKAYQLDKAGRQIPPDIEQYAPGFGDALSSATGNCNRGGNGAPEVEEAPPPPSAGTPGPGVPKKKTVTEPPAPKAVPEPALAKLPQPDLAPATSGIGFSDTPGGLIALLVAAGAALLIALAWAIAWFMGWSPERLTKPLAAAFGSVWDRVSHGR